MPRPLLNGLLLGLLLVVWPASSGAVVFTLDSTVDAVDSNPGDGACASASDGCTLRAAIMETDALPGEDQISLPAGTYRLTLPRVPGNPGATGSLLVTDAVTLAGGGAKGTIIDAAGISAPNLVPTAIVVSSVTGRVVLQDLTLTGASGGGLSVTESDDVRVSRVFITGNGGPVSNAGGISALFSTLTVAASTISGNTGFSGAIFFVGALEEGPALRLTVVNSTVSGNSGQCDFDRTSGYSGAGAIWAAYHSDVYLAYSTVADNLCPFYYGGTAGWALGGDQYELWQIVVEASVLSNSPASNCLGVGFFGLIGPNVDTDGSCGAAEFTALLGPLQDHGGPTPTHALLPGSSAIDAIPAVDCTYDHDGDPATPGASVRDDQRGVRRPQGAGCDIGAFEATACSDGVDNDGDGLVDYPADPGCRFATSTVERTQCQDGLNNDGQTGIDFDGGASVNGGVPLDVPDPQCTYAWQNKERTGCGFGFEVVLIAPLLARLARKRRA